MGGPVPLSRRGEALPDDADIEDLRRNIRDGDRKIKAFGEVDMGVLSEDRNLRDRLAFMGEHLDDVRSSAAELENSSPRRTGRHTRSSPTLCRRSTNASARSSRGSSEAERPTLR